MSRFGPSRVGRAPPCLRTSWPARPFGGRRRGRVRRARERVSALGSKRRRHKRLTEWSRRDCSASINAGADDPPSQSAGFTREQSRGMAIAALLLPFRSALVNAGCGFCFSQRVRLLTGR